VAHRICWSFLFAFCALTVSAQTQTPTVSQVLVKPDNPVRNPHTQTGVYGTRPVAFSVRRD